MTNREKDKACAEKMGFEVEVRVCKKNPNSGVLEEIESVLKDLSNISIESHPCIKSVFEGEVVYKVVPFYSTSRTDSYKLLLYLATKNDGVNEIAAKYINTLAIDILKLSDIDTISDEGFDAFLVWDILMAEPMQIVDAFLKI